MAERVSLCRRQPWLSTAKSDGGYLLRFPKLADFTIDAGGRDINCIEAGDGVTVVTLRHLAIDHVMPRVLNLLGIESLHATAVAAPAGAIAFLGDAGTGKSTLAASFQLTGFESFCDDCLVLRAERSRITAPRARRSSWRRLSVSSADRRHTPLLQMLA
jgi:hypothetical protein